MSRSGDESGDHSDPFDGADRGAVIDRLDELIEESYRKAENGRVYDGENEKVRQGWFRVCGYLSGQYRQLLRDEELEELDDRLRELEGERGRP